jgi:serine/threonine-protein kinase HipA
LPLINTEFLPQGRLAGDAPRAVGAVDDARPDRWGEKVIRFVDKPQRLSLMEYLYYAGDDRFGALGVSTSATEYAPRALGPLPRLEDAQQLSEVAAKVEASEPLSALEARIIAGGGSPFGGAKPKALINIEGAQWVIKFFNNEPVDAPLVEHATMKLAALAGISVAATQVVRLSGLNAVAEFTVCRPARPFGLQRRQGRSRSWVTPSWRACCAVQGWPQMGRICKTPEICFAAWCSTF